MISPSELGIVLRTAPLREADLIVTLYTETLGKISAVARGARKSQRRFSGALGPLVLGKYQLGRKPRGDVWSLDGGEVVRDWMHLAYDVASHAHAGYAAELVGALLPAESPEPTVVPLVTSLWDSLAANGPSPAVLRAFELTLLDLIGQRPALEGCAACGDPELASGSVFDPARGGAICRTCAVASRGQGVRPFEPEARAYLLAVAEAATPPDANALDRDDRFANSARTAGRDALISMVISVAGRPLRSLEYIAKLGAAQRRGAP